MFLLSKSIRNNHGERIAAPTSSYGYMQWEVKVLERFENNDFLQLTLCAYECFVVNVGII